MPNFQSSFNAALPRVIKWSAGENQYMNDELDEHGNPKFPSSLALFIPTESITALANHLMDLADQKQVMGKVWDYTNNVEVEVSGVYINGKGKIGERGSSFGNINPAALDGAAAAPPAPAPARPAAPVPAAAAPARRRF